MKNRFSGEYPPDWWTIRNAVYEATGHRCIRCGHPYEHKRFADLPPISKSYRGEWTPCDDKCTHDGPVILSWSGMDNVRLAQWRILTCHHFDGNKTNCEWWNLLPLCQRCHLQIQGKVDPNTPFFLEHSEWIKPYVAGFYAKKYLRQNITRAQAQERLNELLSLESGI